MGEVNLSPASDGGEAETGRRKFWRTSNLREDWYKLVFLLFSILLVSSIFVANATAFSERLPIITALYTYDVDGDGLNEIIAVDEVGKVAVIRSMEDFDRYDSLEELGIDISLLEKRDYTLVNVTDNTIEYVDEHGAKQAKQVFRLPINATYAYVTDLDHDGWKEFILWEGDCKVHFLDEDDKLRWSESCIMFPLPLVISDLDGDGIEEVIVGHSVDQVGVYDHYGQLLWESKYGNKLFTKPTLGRWMDFHAIEIYLFIWGLIIIAIISIAFIVIRTIWKKIQARGDKG